jgi:polyphosphate kinase 2 (PPK2 family)
MKKRKNSTVPVKAKMVRKDYEKELRKLQVELCELQEWVKQTGLRVILVFEGRDGAGKGGTIKAITEKQPSELLSALRKRHRRVAQEDVRVEGL